MTLEIGLLALESLLLIFTIILLCYSIKEGKQRDKLIIEIGKATRVLSRQEYFLSIMDAMADAGDEIVGCITGRPPSDKDAKLMKNIVENIKRSTGKGVKIKYLMPKFPDRLHVGFHYMKAGAEVYYSSCLMVHNLRYIIVDDRVVVMGIPESTGEREATKKGYRIPSEGLAMVLKHYFATWEKQSNFQEYLLEVIRQTGATCEHISREYNIDVHELKKIVGE